MPLSLKYWPKFATTQTLRIEDILVSVQNTTPPTVQFLLGEILVIRTAQILEEALPEIFGRLVCNTPYIDGSLAKKKMIATGLINADQLMHSHNRKKPMQYLRWLQSSDIRRNVEHLLDANDHALTTVDGFSALINELRIVRNEAAHRTHSTKAKYRTVLLNYYGSSKLLIPVGKFAISDRRVKPPPLVKYTTMVRTLIKDICKA